MDGARSHGGRGCRRLAEDESVLLLVIRFIAGHRVGILV